MAQLSVSRYLTVDLSNTALVIECSKCGSELVIVDPHEGAASLLPDHTVGDQVTHSRCFGCGDVLFTRAALLQHDLLKRFRDLLQATKADGVKARIRMRVATVNSQITDAIT